MTDWNQCCAPVRDWMNGETSGWRKSQWDQTRNTKVAKFKGFFLVWLLKLKNVMSRNWFLIFILFQGNNVADFNWSYSQFLAVVWRAELDPSVALENFPLFRGTSNNYGFPCGCYERVQPPNTSSCSLDLQQFSSITCSKLGFF